MVIIMGRKIEMLGSSFGRLEVLSESTKRGSSGDIFWNCRCDCGAFCEVSGRQMRSGDTRSCGCLNKEVQRASAPKMMAAAKAAREIYNPRVTHGMTGSPTYMVWRKMKERCQNPAAVNYERYGGRGITVCDEWQKFENFLESMGERPKGKSIDRIDNSKGYMPGNCRWATIREQSRNTRSSRYIEAFGEKLLLCEWSERSGISMSTIFTRIQRGWPNELSVSAPIGTKFHAY